MSEIIAKAQAAVNILQDDQIPPWQRTYKSLTALSGMMLSDLALDKNERVKVELAAVNAVTSRYGFATHDDYEALTDSDVVTIVGHVEAVIQTCFTSEIDRIMNELGTAGRKLPVAAIKEVREHRDLLIPHLIASLQNEIASVRNREDIKAESAAFFAAFLLVELQAEEAYPIVLDIFRLPDTQAEEVIGDAAYELAGPILAQCTRGEIGVIEEIVGDRKIDVFQRWSVAHTYKYLVRDKSIERQQAIDSLLRQFETSLTEEDYHLLAPLACELSDLAAEDALKTIRSAFERGLVDESMVRLDSIETKIAGAEETIQQTLDSCLPTGMPDTIKELSRWSAFAEDPPRPSRPQSAPGVVPRPHLLSSPMPTSPVAVRSDAKVGRNDPCPCGSGKKFKKCCR